VDTCRRVGQKPLDVVQRGVTERKARGAAQLRVDIPQLSSSLALGSSTLALVGASTQSRRRSTVSGRMTSCVLAAFEGVAGQVRHTPEETDDVAVVHASRVSLPGYHSVVM
jgi:hypothetical protein